MRTTSRHIVMTLVLFTSCAFPSCAARTTPRPVSGGPQVHTVGLLLFEAGSRCILISTAPILRVHSDDEIEFFLRKLDGSAACPEAGIEILNWIRDDGDRDPPVIDRAPSGASKALKVKREERYRKRRYKYDIRVGSARLDPELEVMP